MHRKFVPLYGDLHNHCGISYGHGTLEDALHNANLRLDFASITGHAAWPDMDVHNTEIAHIVAFHQKGFARLKEGWKQYQDTIQTFQKDKKLLLFPGYEIHSSKHGDYTIIGYHDRLPLVVEENPMKLRTRLLRDIPSSGLHLPETTEALPGTMMFPHHIGYRQGARGVNWDSYEERLSPLVELTSMHGMAESDHTDRPFLHSMGPLQHRGTIMHGLQRGYRFGFIGNTDHHSAHPGSYGHGITGVWTTDHSRSAIWEGLYARRTWANTGESVRLWFSVDRCPMGSVIPLKNQHEVEIDVDALGAIDYVELVDSGTRSAMWWEQESHRLDEDITLNLELGWGERGVPFQWDGELRIENAQIEEIYPRFRGQEVVSPLDASAKAVPIHHAFWNRKNSSTISFKCTSWGNSTNSTPSTQGMALRLSDAHHGVAHFSVSGVTHRYPIAALLKGSESANLGAIDSPAYRISVDRKTTSSRSIRCITPTKPQSQWWYVRVRLHNGHWAISSPVFFERS